MSLSVLAIASLLGTAVAKSCASYNIPVTVTSENVIWGLAPFQDDYDVTTFTDAASSRSAPPSTALFSGTENVTATYTISATFCQPGHGEPDSHKDTVLLATHGLGFNKLYWDPPLDDKYSFVEWAISQGYSTFIYDRIGTGDSSQVSGYVAQLSNQAAVLVELATLIRSGQYTKDIGVPKNIVYVGHSFGSSVSITATAIAPTLIDGVVLTGFSLNTTYLNPNYFLLAAGLRIAATQHPAKWRQLDTGYLTTGDPFSNLATFFHYPSYEKSVFKWADDHKVPLALTELLTVGALNNLPFTFTGVAQIVTGKYDFIFCETDCEGALEIPSAQVFGAAKAFSAITYPDTGHGINLHTTAPGAYKNITDFLAANGL